MFSNGFFANVSPTVHFISVLGLGSFLNINLVLLSFQFWYRYRYVCRRTRFVPRSHPHVATGRGISSFNGRLIKCVLIALSLWCLLIAAITAWVVYDPSEEFHQISMEVLTSHRWSVPDKEVLRPVGAKAVGLNLLVAFIKAPLARYENAYLHGLLFADYRRRLRSNYLLPIKAEDAPETHGILDAKRHSRNARGSQPSINRSGECRQLLVI